jgi:isopropylmalate/homocitrate/citramalate synthase
MSDLPKKIVIEEQGPREGFQIEPGPISTKDKIALIDALSATGLGIIEVASFVNTSLVPGWADAEAVVGGFTPKPGVAYTALWFNSHGMRRALAFKDRLQIDGVVAFSASEAFSLKNLNRDHAGHLAAMRKTTEGHLAAGVPVTRLVVMASFGCNFSGDVAVSQVTGAIEDGLAIARDYGFSYKSVGLADSMGWATPQKVARVVGAVRERWPELEVSLHLHDTRGLGISNAYEGLRLGVTKFDATVGGLGGCPFAAQPGAPGNIASEELVMLCNEMGIETGVDLDALIEAGRLAETIVGHRLPSAALRAGSLDGFRRRAA